jgi:hypothetical protein
MSADKRRRRSLNPKLCIRQSGEWAEGERKTERESSTRRRLHLVRLCRSRRVECSSMCLGNYPFREGQDSNRLKLSVEGRYRKRTGKTYLQRHCDLVTANEEDSNLLQLTDLLVGAVAFCWNGGMLRTSARSSGRKQLVEVIRRSYGGVRLDGQQHKEGSSSGRWKSHKQANRSCPISVHPQPKTTTNSGYERFLDA